MAKQTLELKVAGLYTEPNPLGSVPDGGLSIAENVIIQKPNIAETRRGQTFYGTELPGPPKKIFTYQGVNIVYVGSNLYYDSDGEGTWVQYNGTFLPPDANSHLRAFESNKNLYILTNTGVKKLDTPDGAWRDAGVEPALDGYTTGITYPGNSIGAESNVAYRTLWGYIDANNNEITGAPSQRLVVTNESTMDGDVTTCWQIPETITTEYFYRVFRSGKSAGVEFEPNDELQLVLQKIITQDEIDNGQFFFTDTTPDDLRGALINTARSQGGIANGNYQPPVARDATLYNGFIVYSDTQDKQRYTTNLISVGYDSLNFQNADGNTTASSDQITNISETATLVVFDLTYTSDLFGALGNDITINYVDGGIAGSEVVTVSATNIKVTIEAGVSTATQIETAINGSAPATALIAVSVTGTGSNPQGAFVVTNLENGFDTSLLNVGMRVSGTPIPESIILSIDSTTAITIDNDANFTDGYSLVFNDIFRVDDLEYFASEDEDIDEHEFKIFSDGTPSENIANTSQSLIRVVNRDETNTTVYAYYLSGFSQLPGQILFQERNLGGNTFYLTSTNGSSFSPELQNTGTNAPSDNNRLTNYVTISKQQQPEAVPLASNLPVGSAIFPVVRTIANRETCFIMKEDGVFRLTGTGPGTFIINLMDSSAKIRASESAVLLNNQVWCFSNLGFINISEGGVQYKSKSIINNLLLPLLAPSYVNLEAASFGISYEDDNSYYFFTLTEPDDEFATIGYVYNTITQAYTTFDQTRSCGIFNTSANKLFLGNPLNNFVYGERKARDRSDYADEQYPVFIEDTDGRTLTLTSAAVVVEGMTIVQDGFEALVVSVDQDANTIVVDTTYNWEIAGAIVYTPIRSTVEWTKNSAQNPGLIKHWMEFSCMFESTQFQTIQAGFSTNFYPTPIFTELVPVGGYDWGEFIWGEVEWDGANDKAQPLRDFIPRLSCRSHWISPKIVHEQAFSSFSLSGISIIYNVNSSKFGAGK